jgi:hypothetical protein
MNLAVKFNLLKDTQPHYIYKPESCLENDNYKLYFDRTVLTDIHIQHNRPDIIILNKQQKQAYLLDIAVPNSQIQGGPDITCQKKSGSFEGSNKSKKPLFIRSKITGIN